MGTKRPKTKPLSTTESFLPSVPESSKTKLNGSSSRLIKVPHRGFVTDAYKRKKGIYTNLEGESIIYKEPTYLEGSRLRYIKVELLTDVEFMTHSRTYHYKEGVNAIPLDLAKMLFRLGKAAPVLPVRTVPITKPGRF